MCILIYVSYVLSSCPKITKKSQFIYDYFWCGYNLTHEKKKKKKRVDLDQMGKHKYTQVKKYSRQF